MTHWLTILLALTTVGVHNMGTPRPEVQVGPLTCFAWSESVLLLTHPACYVLTVKDGRLEPRAWFALR